MLTLADKKTPGFGDSKELCGVQENPTAKMIRL
jgi:hypothetical protein